VKNATKGALLSGLVFPGLGQLRLKHYIRGTAWMVVFCACLYIISTNAIHQATSVIDKVLSGDVPLDSTSILEAVTKSSSSSENMLLQISSITIAVSWIGSIVDAFFIGRKIDQDEQSKKQAEREAALKP